MSNENKIESYRIMADSLILSSKAKDSSTSDGSSGGSQIPVVAMPTWDINVLENESEDLMARASVRLKKLKSSYGKNVIFRWIKNWRNLRKAVEITTELDQLVPKLKSTEEELNIWLDVLRSQKSTSLSQGMNLISELESSVIECERNMDLFDELHNDCLQVNFDVSNMSTYLFNALTFNIEVLRELQEPRRRSTSRSTQSPVHGHPNYSHGISHAHGHNLHRHHSGKSTKQGSSKAASKQSVHAHVATASNAHRSPLLNGFNATISPASDDEGSPLTLENLKRLEWELRLSPGTDRTVIKSPLTLPLTLSQKDDEQVANEDDAVNRLTQHVEMIEDSSSIIKSEGVFEFLEPANAIISDGDSENENENEDHDDDDLVFDIVGAIPTSLSTSPAVLPALGVPVAATVNRERKLSFEEIMEPAVWQGFSTNQHHRGIIAHTRSSLSGIRYSRNQNGYVYGSADGLILTKKHSSLSAIETYTQIFAMSNEGTSSGVVTINQDSSNTGLSVVSEAKQNDSEVQAKTNQSISNLLLLPKPLARSSSLTYSPPDPNGTADRVLVKSKSLSLSAIDFSTQFPIVNFGSATRTDSLSIPDEHSASPSLIFADLNTDAIQSVATTPLKSDVTIESVSTTTSISSGQGSNRSYVSSPEKSVNNTSGDVLGILSDVLIDAEIPPSDSDAAVQGTKDNHISINTTITSSNFSVPTAKEAVTAAPIIKESSSTEELVSMNAQLEAVTRAIRSLSNSPPPGVLSRSYSFNLDNDRELGTFLKQETLERSRYEAFVLVKEPYIAEDDDHKSMCAKLQLCQEVYSQCNKFCLYDCFLICY